MTKVLVSDPIDQAGIDILSQVAQVDKQIGISIDHLKQIIGEYDALIVKSSITDGRVYIMLLFPASDALGAVNDNPLFHASPAAVPSIAD